MRELGERIARLLCRFLIFIGCCGWLCLMLLRHADDDDDPPGDRQL